MRPVGRRPVLICSINSFLSQVPTLIGEFCAQGYCMVAFRKKHSRLNYAARLSKECRSLSKMYVPGGAVNGQVYEPLHMADKNLHLPGSNWEGGPSKFVYLILETQIPP